MAWEIGVDVGGTFTDVAAVESGVGATFTTKVLTTPTDPLVGIQEGLDAALRKIGAGFSDVSRIVHGTTLAINTIIERKGARVGLLTTKGFRDVIEIGNSSRYDIYDLQIEGQPVLVPRHMRRATNERMSASGEVLQPVDTTDVEEIAESFQASGVEAIAICFLNAWANDENEEIASRTIDGRLPGVFTSASSQVTPTIREYQRFLTTVINAYVGPRMSTYLGKFADQLAARGFRGQLGVMKSDGGMCSPEVASVLPVQILESGPAGGALLSAETAVECGEELAVAFDMGGTTAKVCLLRAGTPAFTDELEVSRLARFKRGSGLPLRTSSVDLAEIGAGGGSIATIGPLGLMAVGPESAGAEPGPACYGRGGTRPTVTDADLILGYLDPDYFAGGSMTLDVGKAERAIEEHLGARGDGAVLEAAWGIHDLINESMAHALRLHCIEHGVDPRAVCLVATGGAGPVHICNLMRKVGARKAICPSEPGTASAVGLIVAPHVADRTTTRILPLGESTSELVTSVIDELAAELGYGSRYDKEQYTLRGALYMRLKGQSYEIRVELPEDKSPQGITSVFFSEYEQRFGRLPSEASIEIVDWSIRIAEQRRPLRRQPAVASAARNAPPRMAYFGPSHGWCEVPVIDRAGLTDGWHQDGPLVIEEPGSTIVIGPGCSGSLDERRNLHIVDSEA